MPTKPYQPRAPQQPAEWPIVQFARTIGKPTAEFTAKDTRRYLRWLWKQPVNTRAQPSTYFGRPSQ